MDRRRNAGGLSTRQTAKGEVLDVFEPPAAAAFVGRPEKTLRDWRYRGVGPRSFRMGNRVFYRREDLVQWANKQYEKSQTPQAS
jgi:hypothetical protein